MKRIVLPLFLLFSLPAFASFEVTGSSIQRSPRTSEARLYREEGGFFVDNNGEKEFVALSKAFDKHPKLWKAFLKENYLRLDRHEDGHYSLQPKVRGNGGGPVTGAVAGLGCAVLGAGLTFFAATAAVATGHPVEAAVIAVAGTKATVAATITAAEIGTMLPTP